jgi:serine/threonine protein kinase
VGQTRIGRYEVESELGRGSMGVVYLARDPDLERLVAVKTILLPPGLGTEQRTEFAERFQREAKLAGGLTHPGIVTIYEYDRGVERDAPYMVMEYVPGRSLEEIFRSEGRLPVDQAFAIVSHLATALEAAHAAGIVHRDIKPANILLRKGDSAAKITDFGVARFHDSSLTRAGGCIGSPAYMAPEQFRGGPVDARADLFALAVVLYEAITGTRPFRGEDPLTIASSVLHDEPVPVSAAADWVSPSFDRFFSRALAKDPADRFPDAATFRRELDRAWRLASADGEEPPRPGKQGRLVLPVAGGSVALVALALTFWLHAGSRHESPDDGVLVERTSGNTAAPPTAPVAEPRAGRVAVAPDVPPAKLVVDTRSGIKDGRLTLSVDGRVVYRRELAWQGKGWKRAMARTVGQGREKHEDEIELAPGRHEIAARVDVGKDSPPFERTIVVELEPDARKTLRIVAGKTFGRDLTLALE